MGDGLRQPTREELTKDAITIVEAVSNQWDGEVDCIVILCRRLELVPDFALVHNIPPVERRREILRRAKENQSLTADLKARG